MNNELIERIEKRIAVLAAEVELFEGDADYTGSVIHQHTVGILQDCKAALTQQQEAEPCWRPIGSAPKDNSRPLYLASFRGAELIHLDFNGGWESESESWEMPQVYYYWASENGIEDPTHWAYQDEPIPKAAPPHDDLWQAWLAAKEKYEPSIKAHYYAVMVGGFIQLDARSGQLYIYETEAEAKAACPVSCESCEVIEIVATKAVSAPSTQGGGE